MELAVYDGAMSLGEVDEGIVHCVANVFVKALLEPILNSDAGTVNHLGNEGAILSLEFFVDLEVIADMNCPAV